MLEETSGKTSEGGQRQREREWPTQKETDRKLTESGKWKSRVQRQVKMDRDRVTDTDRDR